MTASLSEKTETATRKGTKAERVFGPRPVLSSPSVPVTRETFPLPSFIPHSLALSLSRKTMECEEGKEKEEDGYIAEARTERRNRTKWVKSR